MSPPADVKRQDRERERRRGEHKKTRQKVEKKEDIPIQRETSTGVHRESEREEKNRRSYHKDKLNDFTRLLWFATHS